MTIKPETIAKMTRREKLRLMEDLWADLSRDEKSVATPKWHLELLAYREAEAKAGRSTVSSLADVKKRFHERHP